MTRQLQGMKCVSCGKNALPASLKIEGFLVNGWKCSCGEEYLGSEDLEWLLLMSKTKKEALEAKVSKIGNSYSVRIPKEIVDALNLKEAVLRIQVGMREIRLIV